MAKKPIVYRTKLSIEECRERLSFATEKPTYFSSFSFREREDFKAQMNGNRFWVQSSDGSETRFGIYEPIFYGRIKTDDLRSCTIIEGKFAPSPIVRAGILFFGSLAALLLYFVDFSNITAKNCLNCSIIILIAFLNIWIMRNIWSSGMRKLMLFVKRVFEAERI